MYQPTKWDRVYASPFDLIEKRLGDAPIPRGDRHLVHKLIRIARLANDHGADCADLGPELSRAITDLLDSSSTRVRPR